MAGRPNGGNTFEEEDKMAALTLMVQDIQVIYKGGKSYVIVDEIEVKLDVDEIEGRVKCE